MGLLRSRIGRSRGRSSNRLIVGAIVLSIGLSSGSGRRGRRVGGSGRTSGSDTGAAASDDCGAREGVLEAGVEDLGGVDTGVGSGVRAGELGELSTGGLDRSSTEDRMRAGTN